eukprot:TRINITY_DN528_c0_g1_i1.p1 TRINITY_DN528_c0_g1~~TRINITY_DN528_c0_g1_i1.p1  ORF type:complete len:105 (+),score=6.84 TRINITY_DN528_c0_g1_i1:68-382(+)
MQYLFFQYSSHLFPKIFMQFPRDICELTKTISGPSTFQSPCLTEAPLNLSFLPSAKESVTEMAAISYQNHELSRQLILLPQVLSRICLVQNHNGIRVEVSAFDC